MLTERLLSLLLDGRNVQFESAYWTHDREAGVWFISLETRDLRTLWKAFNKGSVQAQFTTASGRTFVGPVHVSNIPMSSHSTVFSVELTGQSAFSAVDAANDAPDQPASRT